MLAYEERLDEVETATPNEPPRKKIKVTRDISVSKVDPRSSILFKNHSLNMVYDELEVKFKADER